MRGRVYWITGLSNSGKTTIGSALYYDLKKQDKNVIILDGDLMKEIASGTENAEYSDTDRKIRALRYAKMAKLLADQDVWVIVCAIAMFDEVRAWNRENIKGYIEIFLNTPADILKSRDRKGLYVEWENVQYPKTADLIFKNDGSEPIREIVKKIIAFVPRNEEDYDRDSKYWNSYYQKMGGYVIEPSNFAVAVEERLNSGAHVLDLGCGNGRDSLFFLSKGHVVTAVDGSDVAIDMLCERTKENQRALFVCDNFVKCKSLYQMKYDCIYSRFTLHAITEEQENELLNNVYGAISQRGIFCIEARTVHDEIYGMGDNIAHNTFIYNNHFRRFIDVDEFQKKVEDMRFKVISIEEGTGFSKTETSDPVLMRCILSV